MKNAGNITFERNRSLAVNLGFLDGLESLEGNLVLSGSLGLKSRVSALKERPGIDHRHLEGAGTWHAGTALSAKQEAPLNRTTN